MGTFNDPCGINPILNRGMSKNTSHLDLPEKITASQCPRRSQPPVNQLNDDLVASLTP